MNELQERASMYEQQISYRTKAVSGHFNVPIDELSPAGRAPPHPLNQHPADLL